MIRAGYTDITDLFIDTVSRVDDTQWQQAGLGEWTVRDLVGHNSGPHLALSKAA